LLRVCHSVSALHDVRVFTRFQCLSEAFFFFQAEDGIRDRNVTGVQTCALPISTAVPAVASPPASHRRISATEYATTSLFPVSSSPAVFPSPCLTRRTTVRFHYFPTDPVDRGHGAVTPPASTVAVYASPRPPGDHM